MMEEVEGFELGFLLAEMIVFGSRWWLMLLLLPGEEVEGVGEGSHGRAKGGIPGVDDEGSWLTGRALLECSANDPAFFLQNDQ